MALSDLCVTSEQSPDTTLLIEPRRFVLHLDLSKRAGALRSRVAAVRGISAELQRTPLECHDTTYRDKNNGQLEGDERLEQ